MNDRVNNDEPILDAHGVDDRPVIDQHGGGMARRARPIDDSRHENVYPGSAVPLAQYNDGVINRITVQIAEGSEIAYSDGKKSGEVGSAPS